MSNRDFAKLCKISNESVGRFLKGDIPSERIAHRIQAKTKGAITVEELLKKKHETSNSRHKRKSRALGGRTNNKKRAL